MNIENLDNTWDLVVVGGGVTGAGVFLEAVCRGWRTLLLEKQDFAWGTSSRSSKMVHGGLRYLKEGKIGLTRTAVKERERLLQAYPGLVDPLGFLMPVYKDYGPSRTVMGLGLSLYSLMALEKQHQGYSSRQMSEKIPTLRADHLSGGFYFKDAQVDDARLVLRLINDGVRRGGRALNYTAVRQVHRDHRHQVSALTMEDMRDGRQREIQTRAVINATGIWAEELQPSPEPGLSLRPLRGSHLIFPRDCFPLAQVVSFLHPWDKRPVFMFPWEGCAILGTTDVDHDKNLSAEPAITPAETEYLLAGMDFIMPGLSLTRDQCSGSLAGIRPVLSRGEASASAETREHVVWPNQGMVTITGGKLTTFRLLAQDALKAARPWLPPVSSRPAAPTADKSETSGQTGLEHLPELQKRRLTGRYGLDAPAVADLIEKTPALGETVGETNVLWAELVRAVQAEQVRHLTDLLLRRVRLGLLCPRGGADHLPAVQRLCRPHLDWNDARWEKEIENYRQTWQRHYAPPSTLRSRIATE